MIGISFFIEQFLGLITGEIWDCSKEKIRTAYKNYKNATEEEKSFETRMYTAIVDAFCYYTNINPKNARPDIMDFIYTTAEVYFNESQRKQDNTPATLLDALHSLDSKFGDTTLFKNYKNKKQKDDAKIETVANYLQKYIVKDDKFKDEYINEVLTRLLRTGERIEKMQLEQQLFPAQIIAAIKESEHDINATTIEQAAMLREEIHQSPLYQINKTKSVKFENNTKLEYVEKWNERLFLHRRPEDEELTLQNTYIPTLFNIIEPESEKTNTPQDNLNKKLYQFINHGKSLLLIGPPGIGKTSIVCYLANKYKNDPNVIILRFSDWSEEEWDDYVGKTHGSILLKAIINKLHCSEKDLRCKILILDGFDEIKYYSRSNDLLKSFLLQIRNIRGLRVLITSRDNYINLDEVKFQNVIKLCPFDEDKILKYALKMSSKIIIDDEDLYLIDQDVYGIPVILYMAITIGIDIIEETDRIKVYEKIFAHNGGIFDRFATDSIEGYDEYSTSDITYVKESFINILCKTAFKMFFINQDNTINIMEYNKIINSENLTNSAKSELWYDFPIDNLYESGNDIQFIHRSIYEYFVAEYIFNEIKKVLFSTESDLIQNCSTTFANLFCRNVLPKEVRLYLNYKIDNFIKKNQNITNIINIIVNMLSKGSTIYISKEKLNYLIYNKKEKIVDIENVIFMNLMHLLQAIASGGHITVNNNDLLQHILSYLQINALEEMNLSSFKICASNKVPGPATELIELTQLIKSFGIYDIEYTFCGTVFDCNNFKCAFLYHLQMHFSMIMSLNFSNSLLDHADVSHSILINLILNNSSCKESMWGETIFVYIQFTRCDINSAWFSNCYFINTDFSFSSFYAASLLDIKCKHECLFMNTYFKHSEINGEFNNVNFSNSEIISCNLNGIFNNASFENVKFDGGVKFKDGSFINANFSKTKFINADLRGGIFTSADFRGADLDGAIYTHELDDAILD